ncbi:MAG: hypothetical protein IPK83_16135 [Planctomycetes bacterium]|nr:hypothetical protein [Planctomycetota bacterium]
MIYRPIPRQYFFCVAGLIAVMSVAHVSALGQDTGDVNDPAPKADTPQSSETEKLVQLNAGIAAYRRGSYEDAKAILSSLSESDPDNTACQYFLGLIYLKEGLQTQDPDVARQLFIDAQKSLRRVVETADPAAFPFEAYLDLGIAQLGSQELTEEGMEISLRAAQTLQSYVNGDLGRNDRVGHFFLGVAYYRLSSQDRRLSGQDKSRDHRRAEAAFEKSISLAKQDVESGKLAQDDFVEFETKILYYRGLLSIFAQNNSQAKALLQDVVDRGAAGPKTTIVEYSEQLVKKIEEVEKSEPAPMTLDSPVGPLQVEGFFTLGNYYDTNVILLGKDTLIPRGIPNEEDYRFGLQAGFDVSRFLTKKRDNIIGESLFMGVGGSTSHFWQPHIKEFDLNVYGGRAYVNWEPVTDLYLGMQYDHSYTKLGQDPFISSNRITPVLSKTWRRPGDEFNRCRFGIGTHRFLLHIR